MSNMNNKCCQYSFYIPANDQSLCDFLEAQSNLSMSIRLLIKAFLANYGETIPDVTIVDLKELLNNMQFKEGIMDNIMDYKDNRSKKSVDNSSIPTVDVQTSDTFGDVSEEEIDMEVIDKTDATIDVITEEITEDISEDDIKSDIESNIMETESEITETEYEVENDTLNDLPDNVSDNSSDVKDNIVSKPVYVASEVDDIPTVDVEPESPKKIINSSRDSYNSRQNAQSAASMDDIMSMLGGE